MTKLEIAKDGFVTTYEQAIDDKTWEGGVKVGEKHYQPKGINLRPQERAKLNKFMGSDVVRAYLKNRPDATREILKDAAATELRDVFEASRALVNEGKPELGSEEYRLHFNPNTGIVKSEYRRKEEIKANREATHDAVQMANETIYGA